MVTAAADPAGKGRSYGYSAQTGLAGKIPDP
jgi:hypothetical protein